MPEHTGHGVVWRSVLAELAAMPDVKLVQSGRADVWLAPDTAEPPGGRPAVVQLHEAGWSDPKLRRYLEPGFAEHLELHSARSVETAQRLITPSQASRQQVVDWSGFQPERVHAVHHGVDHRRFRPGLSGGRDLVGGPYVLFVGVLHPRKNLDALRAAVAGLAQRGFPHALVVVGNPPADRAEPADLRSALDLPGWPDRLRLLRAVSDAPLAALMAGADAFCLPSFFEGFGLPALEAMACGVPVVVSNRGALPEVVGDAGVVVEPEAPAIAGALERIVSDPLEARSLRAAATRRAAGFTWRLTAEGWLEVLRLAASEG